MTVEISKFLSYVLRHAPQSIGLSVDAGGWAAVDDLLAKASAAGQPLGRAALETVVGESDKKRFTFSEDGKRIRAAQGHSFPVDLGLEPKTPPPVLYHGTAKRFLDSILERGILPGDRQKVHLSADLDTAQSVGRRHGSPVVLIVDTHRMSADFHQFIQADNGVWLADLVPSTYLSIWSGEIR